MMKASALGLILALTSLATLPGAVDASGLGIYLDTSQPPVTRHAAGLPTYNAARGDKESLRVASTGSYRDQAGQALIVDHTNTDISKIPDYWLEQAKKLTFHYAHTTHGPQINLGIEWLEAQNSKYNFDIEYRRSSICGVVLMRVALVGDYSLDPQKTCGDPQTRHF